MKQYIAMWDNLGFETIEDITEFVPAEWDKLNAWRILQGEPEVPNPFNAQLNQMMFRARFNGQRNYELYGFTSVPGITVENLWEWAHRDPQTLVDWIRQNGSKIYSDRSTIKPVIT